jgi:hypothetical protein
MLPAYGRELLELRREGKRPAQPVYVVGDWALARELKRRDRFVLMVELPRDAFGNPRAQRFDFSPLQDLDVAIVPEWFDWSGIVTPQVNAVRPRSVQRCVSVPEVLDPARTAARVMESVECQRSPA